MCAINRDVDTSAVDAQHWDSVYETKDVADVSWYEPSPSTSTRLIRSVASAGRVVDVGAGASELADTLVADGYEITVMDISAMALDLVRERLGDQIAYVVADVLAWQPHMTWDVWHDRAVFHFLTQSAAQAAYARVAATAVRPGGALVIGTFAPDGPEACSGLPTARHDVASLIEVFGTDFDLTQSETDEHVTPWGAAQPFTWAVFRRR